MFTQMLVGRILVLAISIGISYKLAFQQTSDLDGVENALFYRTSYAMLIMRGLGYIAFDSFGLFPME